MSDVVLGAHIGLYLEVDEAMERVAALRSARVERNLELERAATVEADMPYLDNAPKQLGWRAEASALMLLSEGQPGMALLELIEAQLQRRFVTCRVLYPDGSTEEGEALVAGIRREWPYDNLLTGQYQLQGSGPLTETL